MNNPGAARLYRSRTTGVVFDEPQGPDVEEYESFLAESLAPSELQSIPINPLKNLDKAIENMRRTRV